ncbi:hypothetical protein D3C85_1593820 [compost metagenome]
MTGARVCRKPQTPAPKNAVTVVPLAHSVAARFGWSRRRFLTMLKANITIARNGSGSSAEKIEPTHNQTSGAPIQKKW